MPRFLADGRICAGLTGAPVVLDGQQLAHPAGGVTPLDDSRVIYARKVAEPDTWDVRIHDGERETDADPDATQGASTIRGGGGVWAAQTAGGPIRSNGHPDLTILDAKGKPTGQYAGLLDVGPDGTLAYRRSHQAGRGLILRAQDGTETVIVPETAACHDVQVLSRTAAVWIQGGRIHSTLPRPTTPDGTCGVPRTVFLPSGERWVLYFHRADGYERLLLQPWDEPRGYVVTEQGAAGRWPAHRPDLRIVDGDTLEVCWSVTEAEGWGNVRRQAFDLSKPRVGLKRTAPVVTPPSPPVTPPPPVVLPPPSQGTPMKLPVQAKDILRLFAAREDLAPLRKGSDDQRRLFNFMVGQQFRRTLGEKFGIKRADWNRPPSKDSIGMIADGNDTVNVQRLDGSRGEVRGVLYGFDTIHGGTREVLTDPDGLDISDSPTEGDQVFIEVEPFDHLGLHAGQPPTPPVGPTPPTPPSGDPPPAGDGSVLAEVRALRQDMAEVKALLSGRFAFVGELKGLVVRE